MPTPITRQMHSTTTDIVLVSMLLVGMILMGVAMLGVSLKFGPRRGFWNQPAAVLRRPGRITFISMYALALLHVACGIIAATQVPGGGIGVLVVLTTMGAFYVLCAHSFALAHSVARRRAASLIER